MRKTLLKLHLYLGLTAGLFLLLLGLTGSIMSFESDIDHWVHPSLWYVAPGGQPLPESELVARVEKHFAPAKVHAIQILPQNNLAQMMGLTDRSAITVNPYNGAVLGRQVGPNRTQVVLNWIHQLHLRLASNPRTRFGEAAKLAISYAGLVLCILVPTGFILWLRTKRTSVQWKKSSWFRRCFDLHHVIGLYAGLFLFVAAFTGVLIGFDFGEKAIYALTHSQRPAFGVAPKPAQIPGPAAVTLDQAMDTARRTIPSAPIEIALLPQNSKGAYEFIMRVPEETSGSPHSTVAVDPHTGQVLQVRNFLTDSQGFRWIRFNRSIHTGDIWGLPGHILVSLSSLLLVAMVITGIVIWLKKLAV